MSHSVGTFPLISAAESAGTALHGLLGGFRHSIPWALVRAALHWYVLAVVSEQAPPLKVAGELRHAPCARKSTGWHVSRAHGRLILCSLRVSVATVSTSSVSPAEISTAGA